MKRVLAGLCGLVAVAAARPQQPHPDFTGTWVMDTTLFKRDDPALLALTLTVSAHGDTFTVLASGVDQTAQGQVSFTTTSRYLLSGAALPDSSARSPWQVRSLGWRGDSLALAGVVTRGGRTGIGTELWTLGADGILTRRQTNVIGPRTITGTYLFKKRPG